MDTPTPTPVGPGTAGPVAADQPWQGIQIVIPSGDGAVRVESVTPAGPLVYLRMPRCLLSRYYRGDIVREMREELRTRIVLLQMAVDAIERREGALPLRILDRRPVQGCRLPDKSAAVGPDHATDDSVRGVA